MIKHKRNHDRVFNDSRVVYYEPNDWASGESISRCQSLLRDFRARSIVDINDAIEYAQCNKVVEGYPKAFELEEDVSLLENKAKALSEAFAFANQSIARSGISALFEDVESQYLDQLWDLLEESNALKRIDNGDFHAFISSHPYLLRTFLQRESIRRLFSASLATVILDNPFISAEVIISEFGARSDNSHRIQLPKELNSEQIDSIMTDYLNSESANLNYVHVLANWPQAAKEHYLPSAKTRVLAKRRERELTDELFNEASGIEYGMGVSFDPNQEACLDIRGSVREPIFSFSSRWLTDYYDHATILNNFVFVFQFVSQHGLLCMPANPRLVSTLMKVIGLQAKDEYGVHDHMFFINNSRCLAITAGYSSLLNSCKTSIESSIEWFYNFYVNETFHIDGFSIALPHATASYFEKCKSIGPEIERVVKAFTLLVKDNAVDHDLFPFMAFTDFGHIPSFAENKYAFPGKAFESFAFSLFSDQSLLTAPPNIKYNHEYAYDFFVKQNLILGDFYDFQQAEIERLVNLGLLCKDGEGYIKPTFAAALLKKVWIEGALTPYRLPNDICIEIDKLVGKDCLQYSKSLFAPHEADYMNYMYNNKRFSNSQALRNKYDHASGAIDDPNNSSYINDYYLLLNLLICITLKINDELAWRNHIWPELDLIDRPLVGDNWKSL